MLHFKTIEEYYKRIGLSMPKHAHFDIRSFDENMGKVTTFMPPFRHEMYFIGIKVEGSGKTLLGHNTDFPSGVTVFFNSPFQIQSWDHAPDWSGYYVLFSQDFIASSHHFDHLLDDYPFLKIDESTPFEIDEKQAAAIMDIYSNIKEEYASDHEDKFSFIEIYILQLLNQVRRLYNLQVESGSATEQIRKADLKLLASFQALIKTSFYPTTQIDATANLHSPSYYAELLSIHPNHLNAVIKSITGQTALYLIHDHILKLAKAALSQTNDSAKEIAYSLHFDSPSHFGSFFKKHTGMSPLAYRKTTNL